MTLRGLAPTDRLEPGGDMYPGSTGAALLLERGEGALEGLRYDTASDRLLASMYHAILLMAREIGDAAWGSDLGPGRAIIDPVVCKRYALAYAAQAVLAELPVQRPGETLDEWDARARLALTSARPWRGTRGAVRVVAMPYLTGTRAVRIVMRSGDDWTIEVRVRNTEIINLPALEAAVNNDRILRAGQRAIVTPVTPGSPWTIGEMEDAYASRTIGDLEADFATIADLENHPGGL